MGGGCQRKKKKKKIFGFFQGLIKDMAGGFSSGKQLSRIHTGSTRAHGEYFWAFEAGFVRFLGGPQWNSRVCWGGREGGRKASTGNIAHGILRLQYFFYHFAFQIKEKLLDT